MDNILKEHYEKLNQAVLNAYTKQELRDAKKYRKAFQLAVCFACDWSTSMTFYNKMNRIPIKPNTELKAIKEVINKFPIL